MRVVFRVDSSTQIGAGHLIRCLALAEDMLERKMSVSFICRNLPGNFIKFLRAKKIPVILLSSSIISPKKSSNKYFEKPFLLQKEDALETISALNNLRPDWLIVDHYEIDIVWEQIMRSYCSHLMVIDDLVSRQHDCDILLNQNNTLTDYKSYKNLVPLACRVLLGPSFALLRKEFQILRQKKIIKNEFLQRFLVFFTAGNDQGETLKAMNGLAIFSKAKQVNIVIGKENPDIIAIKSMCSLQKWGLHCQIDYMPKLIAEADFVIGSGGSSNWERCALGVPALIVILAENQVNIAKTLVASGAVINLGWNANLQAIDYAKSLNAITARQIISMAEKAYQLVDAKGAERVVEMLADKENTK